MAPGHPQSHHGELRVGIITLFRAHGVGIPDHHLFQLLDDFWGQFLGLANGLFPWLACRSFAWRLPRPNGAAPAGSAAE